MQAYAATIVDESRTGKSAVDPDKPPPPLPSVGDIIGSHYRLMRVLGEGAFGRVYVAQRIDVPEHQVALKILPRSVYEGRNVERELVMLATVGHPHVVQLKDHGTDADYVWLTMPVYEGETLIERLDRSPLTLREAYDIILPIARGLEALHGAGLRHQDIKPENIYLARFGGHVHPILLDLGVAAEREATFVAGTLIYGAPEQMAAFAGTPGEIPLSEKMDTYGLAATLLIALVGPSGFPGVDATSMEEITVAHAVRAERPLRDDVLPGLRGRPRDLLEAAFRRWLALDPRERPSMSQMAEDLDVLLESEREEARADARRRAKQRASLMRIRATVVLMLIVGAAAALVMFSKRETLRLANELDKARLQGAESFTQLDTCVAAHRITKIEMMACRQARETDRSECKATLDAMAKSGSTNEAEHARALQNLQALYMNRLRGCEESVTSEKKASESERSRERDEWAKEKARLVTERDEAKKLADARATEINALTAHRDRTEVERAACVTEREACKAAVAAAEAEAQAHAASPSASPSSSPKPPDPPGAQGPPLQSTVHVGATSTPSTGTPPSPQTAPPPPAVPPAQGPHEPP